jgi:Ca2+-binding RTX toxin-like protein
MTAARVSHELLEPRTLFAVDLTVTSDFIQDTAVYADAFDAGFITLNIGVTNLGSTTAFGIVGVDIILSKDKQISPAADSITREEATEWEDLPGGEGDNFSYSPDVEPAIAAGYYYVGLRIDPESAFPESNENNNVFWSEKPRVLVVTEAWPSGSITGTAGNDVIIIEDHVSDTFVTVNGVQKAMDPYQAHETLANGIFIDAGPGNDRVNGIATSRRRLQVTGNTGNDTLSGGGRDDELSGSYGYDRVYGGGGHDLLLGGPVNDYLNGEAGDDIMIGGGGNDRLVDFVGRDHFIAGAGNDVLLSRDTKQTIYNNPDTLSGGTGFDAAQVDTTPSADNLVSIEEMIA